jgi:hypothetical protein
VISNNQIGMANPILLNSFPNILKNSYDLAKDINSMKLPPDTYLVTMDVTSLYTNINTNRLFSIISNYMGNAVADCCEYICNNNYFQYGYNIYKQIFGIAMGSNSSVSFANLYLGVLLDPIIESNDKVFYYKRYIDDLFIIWQGSIRDFRIFEKMLNKLISNIQFETIISLNKVDFLDITITHATSRLEYTTYFKPISRFLFITPKSYHPKHIYLGLVKAELTRYNRLCSNKMMFLVTSRLFYNRLLLRGFSRQTLNIWFKSYRYNEDPFNNIESTDDNSKNTIRLILPHSTRNNYSFLTRKLYTIGSEIQKDDIDFGISFSTGRRISSLICSSSLTAHQCEISENTV